MRYFLHCSSFIVVLARCEAISEMEDAAALHEKIPEGLFDYAFESFEHLFQALLLAENSHLIAQALETVVAEKRNLAAAGHQKLPHYASYLRLADSSSRLVHQARTLSTRITLLASTGGIEYTTGIHKDLLAGYASGVCDVDELITARLLIHQPHTKKYIFTVRQSFSFLPFLLLGLLKGLLFA